MSDFHVMMHDLVPEHYLLEEDEEDTVLNRYGIKKEDLPKILHSDPCVSLLEEKNGKEIKEGRIIKVVRPSKTAGMSETYRLVVWG